MTKHVPSAPALTFHDQKFTITHRDGQQWLRLPQIEGALGYSHKGKALNRIYQKHAAEFTDRMTAVVKLKTAGGEQEVRIFSLRGAHLLGMFARTERAAEFRRWVLDILDGQNEADTQRRAKPGANVPAVQPVPQARAGITPNLRSRINKKAHALALEQYDTIHDLVETLVTDNLRCGATEPACEDYIERFGSSMGGATLVNDCDLYQLARQTTALLDKAGEALAVIHRLERHTGMELYHRQGDLPLPDSLCKTVLGSLEGHKQ